MVSLITYPLVTSTTLVLVSVSGCCLRERERDTEGLAYTVTKMEKMNNNNTIIQIRDALSRVNQKVNLIGFVREFSFPRKSLGTGTFFFFFLF